MKAPGSPECGNGRIAKCVTCSLPLPLCFADLGPFPTNWECVGCGSTYFAAIAENADPRLLENLRLSVKTEDDATTLAEALRADGLGQFELQGTSKTTLPDREPVLCDRENSRTRLIDRAIDRVSCLGIDKRGNPFANRILTHGATSYSQDTKKVVLAYHQATASHIADLCERVRAGKLTNIETIQAIVHDALAVAAKDMDLFVYMAANPRFEDYPSRHLFHVAILAISIGATMGLDELTLGDLGTGCLIHDMGMLDVSAENYEIPGIIETTSYRQIAEHPIRLFELLDDTIDEVAIAARMVAYQMHERCNGTGYPRGWRADRIHPLAKIAAVADVFIALVSPRPHRPGMLPYYAIEKVIYDMKEGQFDPRVVRSLLQTVSLFPIGSNVVLNDGRVAKVLRTNREQYDRPLVAVYDNRNKGAEPTLIQLSLQSDFHVIRPLYSGDRPHKPRYIAAVSKLRDANLA